MPVVIEILLLIAAAIGLSAVFLLICLSRGWIFLRSQITLVESLKDGEARKTEADRDSWRNLALAHLAENRALTKTNRELKEALVEMARALGHPSEEPQKESDGSD